MRQVFKTAELVVGRGVDAHDLRADSRINPSFSRQANPVGAAVGRRFRTWPPIPRYWLLDSSALEAAGTVARPVGQLADMGAQGRDGGGCPVCLGSFSERDHHSKANRPAMLHGMCCG
jgi:hypothetical protein